jgi:hypothetical protein
MQRPLDDEQCHFLLHLADLVAYADSAGVSLSSSFMKGKSPSHVPHLPSKSDFGSCRGFATAGSKFQSIVYRVRMVSSGDDGVYTGSVL